MNNSKSLQHELKQVKITKVGLRKSSANLFIFLLTRHPWLLLTGVLATCLGSATLALYNLIHVNDMEKAKSESVPAVVEIPTNTNTEMANPIPLWMVAAIALSCASGCLVILRLVNQPKKHPTVAHKHQSVPQLLVRTRQQRFPKRAAHTQTFLPSAQPMRSRPQSVMTILPPEQKHPLDHSKESLADLVDWRKHNSLSALLQKY